MPRVSTVWKSLLLIKPGTGGRFKGFDILENPFEIMESPLEFGLQGPVEYNCISTGSRKEAEDIAYDSE